MSRGPVVGEAQLATICEQEAFFREYAAIPKELTTGDQLPTAVGAPVRVSPTQAGCQLVEPDYNKPIVLSVLFAMFLHGGWLHLLGNMLFLWVFGNNVEDRLGAVRYLLFYVVTGYAATYAFAFANASSETTLVGASGAVAGILGAYLVLFPRARITSLVPLFIFFVAHLPAWVVLGSWFLLQWLYSAGGGVSEGGGVAYLAHVAGFIAGVIGILILRPRRKHTPVW